MWRMIFAVILATAAPTADRVDIRITRQQARWAGPWSPSALAGGDADSWYVISGELENRGAHPLAYVKLAFELLDESSKVVASEVGYNRRAEDLNLPEVESGRLNRADLHIPPLGPGETDTFRMLFIRAQVRRFSSWRVRVLRAEPGP